MWKRLRCLFGRHHRDRSKVVEYRFHDRSVCKYCGKPMVKVGKRWRRQKPGDTHLT